ncbi:CPBP family intramembrane glutamic endopeptidase [Rhodanobacter sp. L36]|uniref:CPBP family intramembrane glutamic endopeptidase n=1 Tax=Rhodanobacter sp. L36 TaxID=1747221 RepID=UPI00131D9FD4|nr:CPBP family intramembrane glutamic endopeptidase [Rhodanobacter sp. L36]
MTIDRATSRIGIFLLLTLVLSAVFYALIIGCGHVGGGMGLYVTGLMWSPGTAALITCRITGKPVAELGFGWGCWRWNTVAYLLPVAYAGAAYLLIWLTGLGDFGNATFFAHMAKDLGWPNAPMWLVGAASLLLLATIGMVESTSTALGEEIGWRGFLAPEMTRAFGFTRGAFFTGAIWTVWHLPILLFADYNAGTPWWFAMPCFAVMVMSITVAFNWLRLRSGSLWPAAILHASHNLFIQEWFTPITGPRGHITPYAIDEFGFMLPLVCIVVAVVFWRRRGELTAA